MLIDLWEIPDKREEYDGTFTPKATDENMRLLIDKINELALEVKWLKSDVSDLQDELRGGLSRED